MPRQPPMYVKFTCGDKWLHIPADEVFPVWIEIDIARAALVFQQRHRSRGRFGYLRQKMAGLIVEYYKLF